MLQKDIEFLKKTNCNAVSMGIFARSALEPEEGRYNFEWMEKIFDDLYKNGISVILATPSGARPKWLADKYPEVLMVDENRNRNLFGAIPITVLIRLRVRYDGLNYFKFKDIIDIVSWGTYPTWHKREDSIIAMDNGMSHNLMRSIKNQPYLLMECTPYGLMDVFGLRSQEIDGLYDWETNTANPEADNILGITSSYSCNHLCELVKTDGAVPLMVSGADFYKGLPVLTVNRFGSGEAYYICADMESGFYDDVCRQ